MSHAALELSQHLDADAATVWAALASEDGLRSWWWRHWDDVSIAADVAVGGQYRIVAPGARITLEGSYLVVEPLRQLAFSWIWTDDGGTSRDEAVDIRLAPDGAGTRLDLRHTGPWPDDEQPNAYRQGWDFVLAELGRVLSQGARPGWRGGPGPGGSTSR